MKLEVYTLPSCSLCQQLKALLDNEGIPYIELDANEHKITLISKGILTVPVISINGSLHPITSISQAKLLLFHYGFLR